MIAKKKVIWLNEHPQHSTGEVMHKEQVRQVFHFFIERLGGTVSATKLLKMIYFADRRSLQAFNSPISYDGYQSTPLGPTLVQARKALETLEDPIFSSVLMHANLEGAGSESPALLISVKHPGSDTHDVENVDFDLFSVSIREILDWVLAELGSMSDAEIIAYAQSTCPEWQSADPDGLVISEKSILMCLGYSEEDSDEIFMENDYHRSIHEKFSN
jgi:uncharacterized phage-associated protein